MRKNVIYLMGCAAVMILAASCAGRSKDSTAQKTVPEFVLTYAENQAEDYPTTQGAYKFAELVYEQTGGRVEIQVNAGGVLGDEKTVIEQLQFGGVDFARVSLSPLAEFVPKLNVLQMPYLYTGADHMWKVLEGPIGDDFLNSFDGSGLIALSWYDAGARSFYNSIKPIEKLEDIKGMTIRVQESELMSDTVRALGAVPVPMIYGEVYSGLQTGKVDGAENNWPSYESAGHRTGNGGRPGVERQNRKRRTESTARNGGRHRGSQWCQADRQGGSADDEGHRGSTAVTELRIV